MEHDKEAAELLPCPFCGGEPYFERMGTYRASCIIVCGSCSCSLETGEEGEMCGNRWNDRAALTASEAKAAALQAMAKEGREEARSWARDGYTGPWLLMERMAVAIDLLLKQSPLSEAASQQPEGWQPITKPGQVKLGHKLRFELCGETKTHTVRQVLNAGTDREEIIYHKGNNWYVITSMAIANKGSQKNVRFLSAAPQPGAQSKEEA